MEDIVERAFNPSGTVFLLFFWAFFHFGWFFILHVVDTVTDVALKITVGTVPLLARLIFLTNQIVAIRVVGVNDIDKEGAGLVGERHVSLRVLKPKVIARQSAVSLLCFLPSAFLFLGLEGVVGVEHQVIGIQGVNGQEIVAAFERLVRDVDRDGA